MQQQGYRDLGKNIWLANNVKTKAQCQQAGQIPAMLAATTLIVLIFNAASSSQTLSESALETFDNTNTFSSLARNKESEVCSYWRPSKRGAFGPEITLEIEMGGPTSSPERAWNTVENHEQMHTFMSVREQIVRPQSKNSFQ